MSWAKLWSFRGRTDRRSYFLVGIIAFLLKSNIDRVVASYVFGRKWGLLNYWFPFQSFAHPVLLNQTDRTLGFVLLAISLPFIWLGIAQTVRRLRDCDLPLWLSGLFFIPFANLLFFAVLCVFRSKTTNRAETTGKINARSSEALSPTSSKLFAALLAVGLTTVVGLGAIALGTLYRANYGVGLFVGLPFCLGLFSTLVYSYRVPRSQGECIAVSIVPMLLVAAGLLLLAIEGVICILMAAPIATVLSMIGGMVGYWVQAGRWRNAGKPVMMGIALAVMPLWMWIDPRLQGEPPLLQVRSAIEIDAPPEIVWSKVVAFSEIPEKRDWLFHTGIAYPIRATISGNGPGAIRRCEFSTGPFVEPIKVWDEPRLLKFGVTQNPAPMEELTPYRHIDTPHLGGYFVSHEGQFALTPLQGNRTLLEGTTWYTDQVWPTAYWRIWSDYIIHRIHMRVLQHIRVTAEAIVRGESNVHLR